MARTILFSGFDLLAPEFASDTRILSAPPSLPALPDVAAEAARVLKEPIAGLPLPSQLWPGMRVTVVVDDPSLPVPPLQRDCRREMLEAVLEVLAGAGLGEAHVTVLVANGLSRQWRPIELVELLGDAVTSQLPTICHDAEAQAQLLRIGEAPEGPVEFNRAVAEADLVVHLNVVATPLHAGMFPLVAGTTGYRTARFLFAPELFEEQAPLQPGSRYHAVHERLGALLRERVPVFQVSAVLNNDIYTPQLSAMIRNDKGLPRSLQVWNAMPNAVRHRAARMLRSNARPITLVAGPPDAVAQSARDLFYRQNEQVVEDQAQVVMFGLPDQGPASVGTSQNPILVANLALGYVMNLFTRRPLLAEGGVIIFANPLTPQFDRLHLPHEEFYEKVLRLERDPVAIGEKYEPYFAGKLEFVANYQRNYAFHGAHPLFMWAMGQGARNRASRIIVAQGDPRACARLGFTPAKSIDDALSKAKEALAEAQPTVSVVQLPPAVWARVNG